MVRKMFRGLNEPFFPEACMRVIDYIDGNAIPWAVDSICRFEWGWQGSQQSWSPADGQSPDVLFVDEGNVCAIIATGVRSPLHITNVMESVMNDRFNRGNAPASYFAQASAFQVAERLNLAERVRGKRVLFFGHSYGSGTVAAMCYNFLSQGIIGDYRLCMVGPPRSLTDQGWAAISNSSSDIWQINGDAVPFVMPHTDEAGRLGLLYSRSAAARADSLHVRGDVNVIDDATGVVTVLPTPVDPPVGSVLSNVLWWAFALDRFTGQKHSKPAYLQAFRKVLDNLIPVTDSDSGGGEWGQGITPTAPSAPLIAQAMTTTVVFPGASVSASPPPNLSDALGRQRLSRRDPKDVIVDGVVVGADTRSGLRRKVRARYNSLKKLFRKLRKRDAATLAALVAKW